MKITHYWRWRSPEYLIACGSKNGVIDRDGFFNCKRCLKVITSKNWAYMMNSGHALMKYIER